MPSSYRSLVTELARLARPTLCSVHMGDFSPVIGYRPLKCYPGNGDAVFIWEKLYPAKTDNRASPPFSYEHIKIFYKEIAVRRDLGNRAGLVDRAHMKRT